MYSRTDRRRKKKSQRRPDGKKQPGGTTNFIAMYLFDVTEINKLQKENEEQKLVTGLIYIDNYDEIFDDLEEVRHSLLSALVDRKINKYMANVDAIVRSYEKDKYMFVMPKKYLPQLQENKFALLDEVKAINIEMTFRLRCLSVLVRNIRALWKILRQPVLRWNLHLAEAATRLC